MRSMVAVLALSLVSLAAPVVAQDAVPIAPDLAKSPGAINPSLTQDVICNSAFSTKEFRKASKSDRKCVRSRYGDPTYAFTFDHIIPLELGGADSCDNLWPEPRAESRLKDKLENAIQAHVCVCHDLTLAEGQKLFLDWRRAYPRYVTPKGTKMCVVNP